MASIEVNTMQLKQVVRRKKGGIYTPMSKCYRSGTLRPAKVGQGLEKAGHRLFPVKNPEKKVRPPI
jgi:hypothetical protein